MKILQQIILTCLAGMLFIYATTTSALANQEMDFTTLLDTYYFNPTSVLGLEADELEVDAVLVEESLTIDNSKLIPIYATNTLSESELLKMCNEIQDGERLSNLIISDGSFYTLLYDKAGDAVSYAIVKNHDLKVHEYGDLNQHTKMDFVLDSDIQNQLLSSNLDINLSSAVFCKITDFAVGTLIFDNENEYFVPSVDTFQSSELITVGELYAIDEIVSLIESNIDGSYINEDADSENSSLASDVESSQSKESHLEDDTDNSPTGAVESLQNIETQSSHVPSILIVALIGVLAVGLYLWKKHKLIDKV